MAGKEGHQHLRHLGLHLCFDSCSWLDKLDLEEELIPFADVWVTPGSCTLTMYS
jgi:hypothetical protein